jgi:hypothetical protein
VAVAGRNEWLGDLEADTAAQAPSSERKIEHAFESTLHRIVGVPERRGCTPFEIRRESARRSGIDHARFPAVGNGAAELEPAISWVRSRRSREDRPLSALGSQSSPVAYRSVGVFCCLLPSEHVAYNPVSYQLGSVWPHDNAIIVDGCARYGNGEAAGRIARALIDSAERFRYGRLPEVFGGLKRDEGSFPVQYLGANVPQAWASGAVIHLVRALLGIEPDAPNKRLSLRPQLPDWLGEVELSNLRVGDAWVDLRVSSEGVAIEDRRGELDVQFTGPSG